MKIFDSRKSIVMASIGVLFATLALVSCEKREEPLLNDMAKYSKTVVFTEQQVQTRATAYTDYNTQMPDADYVLRAEESTDSMFLSAYITDLESEQLLTRATETTTDNLGQFRILAYNVNSDNSLRINEGLSQLVGKNSDGTWSYGAITNQSEKNWSELGNNTVKFYAYANLPTAEGAVSNTGLPSTQFRLTLPTNATEQTDIIVAEAAETYQSNNTQQVPLQFNHICAGIRFVMGTNKDVNCYISSIKIHNVISQGIYDVENSVWEENSAIRRSIDVFTAEDGVTTNGSEGTQVGETLMLIPQPLDQTGNVTVEIKFQTEEGESILSATLTSGSWDAGKMYTYKISTTAITLLEFMSQPQYQDAHYVIYPIKIYLNEQLSTATLTAKVEGTNEVIGLKKDDTYNSYDNDGYWIEYYDGETKKTDGGYLEVKQNNETKRFYSPKYELKWENIGSTGEHIVYLFLPENFTNKPRKIICKLEGTSDNNVADPTPKDFEFYQFCPTSTGCERIEENAYVPWGPYWADENGNPPKITYTIPEDKRSGWDYFVLSAWANLAYSDNWLLGIIGDILGVEEIEGVEANLSRTTLLGFEVDYSSYVSIQTTGTGLANTRAIYNGDNQNADMSAILNLESQLQNILGVDDITPDNIDKVDFENSAVIMAVKKNKFKLTKQTEDGQTTLTLSISNNDINWHLPSITEIPNNLNTTGANGETALSGIYWSSTTTPGSSSNSEAYDWEAKSSVAGGAHRTTDTYKCRAVRAVTNGSTFQNATN